MRILWLFERDHRGHPFLSLGLRTLAAAGHDVAVLDRGERAAVEGYRRLRLGPMPKVKGRLIGRLRFAFDYTRFLLRALKACLRERPDVIVASLPGVAAAGWAASVVTGSRRVYYPFELYGDQHVRRPWFWRRLENGVLARAADAVITQNEHRARVYVEERGSVQPALVRNYKPARSVVPAGRLRALAGLPPDARVVLYEGQLTEGRWLPELVAASAHFPEGAYLVMMGEKKKWWVRREREFLAATDRVRILDEVPHEQVFPLAADADLGVIIYDDAVRNNVYCAPGKLSDYVLAGVPVVVPEFPTIAPLVREYGIGTVFAGADPRAIARAVAEGLEGGAGRWRPGLERARKDFIWETQAPAFLGAVTGRAAEAVPMTEATA